MAPHGKIDTNGIGNNTVEIVQLATTEAAHEKPIVNLSRVVA
jgi:hypothetical protein